MRHSQIGEVKVGVGVICIPPTVELDPALGLALNLPPRNLLEHVFELIVRQLISEPPIPCHHDDHVLELACLHAASSMRFHLHVASMGSPDSACIDKRISVVWEECL